MLQELFEKWTDIMDENQFLGFLIAYAFIFVCVFVITWLAMILAEKNWAYSLGWSIAFAAVLPWLVLSIIMVFSSLTAKDEDGDSKPDIKNAAVGAAGTFMFVKAIVKYPPMLGIWMQEHLSSDPVAQKAVKTSTKTATVNANRSGKSHSMTTKNAAHRASEDSLKSENTGWSEHSTYFINYV